MKPAYLRVKSLMRVAICPFWLFVLAAAILGSYTCHKPAGRKLKRRELPQSCFSAVSLNILGFDEIKTREEHVAS